MIFEKYNKYIKYNLQMFNDDGDDGDDGKGAEPKLVTMAQEDFDAKFNKAFAKGSKKAIDDFKNSDEYKELLKLKDDNSTETEKIKERLKAFDAVQAELEKIKAENASLKNRSKLNDLSDADQLDYVMFEINKLIDDKTDFDDALKKFKESKPQYFKGEDDDKGNPNFKTSPTRKKTESKKTDAESYLDRRYKNSPYRK